MEYREILFEVWSERGKFRIYANGDVEGFGDKLTIINSFPLLRERYVRDYLDANGMESKSPTAIGSTSSLEGAAHSTSLTSEANGEYSSAALGEK